MLLKAGMPEDSSAVKGIRQELAAIEVTVSKALARDPKALALEAELAKLKEIGATSAIALVEAQIKSLDLANPGPAAQPTSTTPLTLEAKRLKKAEMRSNFERSHANAAKLFGSKLEGVRLQLVAYHSCEVRLQLRHTDLERDTGPGSYHHRYLLELRSPPL